MTTATAVRPIAPLLRVGLPAVFIAAVVTTAMAALGLIARISLDMAGAPIPPLGFESLTVIFGLVGVLLAVALARSSSRPRRVFVVTTLVLLVLSLVPDVLADVTGSTRALLIATHLVAAAIVVPVLARRLP